MSKVTLRVVKIGGSLLDLPDIASRLRTWLSKNPAIVNLIVVGGGELAEEIRRLDRIHDLDQCFTHWLCIDLLEQSAQIACELFPEFACISTKEELQAVVHSPATGQCTAVVKIRAFYSREQPESLLPENWSTTSDALAALLAHRVQAQELRLLKSVSPPLSCTSLTAWAEMGMVDQAFGHWANCIPWVTLENLRAD